MNAYFPFSPARLYARYTFTTFLSTTARTFSQKIPARGDTISIAKYSEEKGVSEGSMRRLLKLAKVTLIRLDSENNVFSRTAADEAIAVYITTKQENLKKGAQKGQITRKKRKFLKEMQTAAELLPSFDLETTLQKVKKKRELPSSVETVDQFATWLATTPTREKEELQFFFKTLFDNRALPLPPQAQDIEAPEANEICDTEAQDTEEKGDYA